MDSFWSQWALILLTALVIGRVIRALSPEQMIRQITLLTGGIFLITLLVPLPRLAKDLQNTMEETEEEAVSSALLDTRQETLTSVRQHLKEICDENLERKLELAGFEGCRVSVSLEENDDGQWQISRLLFSVPKEVSSHREEICILLQEETGVFPQEVEQI